tara:strand:+ start:42451 stop:43368 length:918 start_codon:yes stop_codon:yes gene_type:complete
MFGAERSGTTLLSMMVGAHPEIAVPLSPTGLWYRQFKSLPESFSTAEGTERVVNELLAHERIKLWDQQLDKEALLQKIEPGDFGSLVAAFHSEYANQCSKPYWASMDIASIDNMHLANRWLPTARFIHLVRDGRDVALSHQNYPYGFGNIVECARAWSNQVTLNLRMGAMIDSDRYLVLRYEDLILDTEKTLSRLCHFIGVEFAPAMLSYAASVERKVPKEKRTLWPALAEPPVTSKAGRWRAEMSRNQRILFEQLGGDLLRELGYETFEKIPRSITALVLELGYCLGQGHRLKRLRQRLGLQRG